MRARRERPTSGLLNEPAALAGDHPWIPTTATLAGDAVTPTVGRLDGQRPARERPAFFFAAVA